MISDVIASNNKKENCKLFVAYRFISIDNQTTDERFNIGIIIENTQILPYVKYITNLEGIEKIFPSVNPRHIESCTKIIQMRYIKQNKTLTRIKISNSLSIGAVRTYALHTDNFELDELAKLLLEQYVSLQAMHNRLSFLFQLLNFDFTTFKLKTQKQSEIKTYSLIQNNHMTLNIRFIESLKVKK